MGYYVKVVTRVRMSTRAKKTKKDIEYFVNN